MNKRFRLAWTILCTALAVGGCAAFIVQWQYGEAIRWPILLCALIGSIYWVKGMWDDFFSNWNAPE